MSDLIYIMGKSASGKDTIKSIIQKKFNYEVYVLYTTRPMREGEKNGIDYNFVTDEQIIDMENQGKIIEKRVYNVITNSGPAKWTYATIDDEQWNRDADFITVGTLESYNQIKEYFKNDYRKKIIPVYIEIDEEERRKRYIGRESKEKNPNMDEIKRRLEADNIDFSEENLQNSGILQKSRFKNYEIEKCVQEICEYIEQEIGFKNRIKVAPENLNKICSTEQSNKYEIKEKGIVE